MEVIVGSLVFCLTLALWKLCDAFHRIATLEREIEDTWVWIGNLEQELSDLRESNQGDGFERLEGDGWKDV